MKHNVLPRLSIDKDNLNDLLNASLPGQYKSITVNNNLDVIDNPDLFLYRLRQYVIPTGTIVLSKNEAHKNLQNKLALYFKTIQKNTNTILLTHPKFGANAIDWGDDPWMFGPRDYFRLSITFNECKRLNNINTILDYGCGVGNMVAQFAKHGYTVTGMDISTLALQFITNNHRSATYGKNISLIHGTLDTVPIRSSQFDAIWSTEVLEHIPNDQEIIHHFYRILKPGGSAIISVPRGMEYWSDVDEYNGHYRRYTEQEIKERFEQAGFIVTKTIVWSFPLGILWDTYIYYYFLRLKTVHKQKYMSRFSIIVSLLKHPVLVKLGSLPFYFDQLWNWTKRGKGIILIAQKPASVNQV